MLSYRAQGTLGFKFSRPGVGPQNLDLYSLQTDSNISATCSSYCPINSQSRLSTGRRSFLEPSRTKGGGGSSHNSWKARVTASLYLPCCQPFCQLSRNNVCHDNNNWPGITHRQSGATAGTCSSITTCGRVSWLSLWRAPLPPSPGPPHSREQAVLLMLKHRQESHTESSPHALCDSLGDLTEPKQD